MKKCIYAVGIGPGALDLLTPRASDILTNVDLIVGYNKYLDMIPSYLEGKEIISNGMRGEVERCTAALDAVNENKTVAVISSGDAGIYGMAGLLFELCEQSNYADIEVIVVPGVTAATAAAAVLGAPLMNDFAVISLSDLLTPIDIIRKRLTAVAVSDLVTILYNPRSTKRKALFDEVVTLFQKERGNIYCGIVRHASRKEESTTITKIAELPIEQVDMSSFVVIGRSQTIYKNNKLYTTRGYKNKYDITK
jgi:precorrin-3B C17-methyltransferase